MSDLFRVHADKTMSPPTGISPTDGRWGGEMPEEYVSVIFEDVNSDIEDMVAAGIPPEELVPSVIIQTIMRTAQRLAVELDGCRIDTTTIFEDMGELGLPEDSDD